jgi:hypothetical protein
MEQINLLRKTMPSLIEECTVNNLISRSAEGSKTNMDPTQTDAALYHRGR